MSSKNSMIFYYDWLDTLESLNDENCAILVKGLVRYARDGISPAYKDKTLSLIFNIFAKQIDKDKEKYIEKCERNAMNIKRRWRENNKDTTEYDRIRSNTNVCSGIKSYTKNTDNDNDSDNDSDINTYAHQDALASENDLINEFEKLWELYPRKRSKSKAMRSYINARKRKKDPVTYEQVKNGIEAYNRYIRKMKMDTQYVKHGSTWFHQECWNDDYTSDSKPKAQGNAQSSNNGWY